MNAKAEALDRVDAFAKANKIFKEKPGTALRCGQVEPADQAKADQAHVDALVGAQDPSCNELGRILGEGD